MHAPILSFPNRSLPALQLEVNLEKIKNLPNVSADIRRTDYWKHADPILWATLPRLVCEEYTNPKLFIYRL